MIFFKHRRSAERDTFSVPHSVQKSIPIKRIYQDGVFQVSGKFSKTWRFFDVNYAVASPEKQRELFMTYCSFLNSLPIGATAKITLFNRQLNQKDFGRTLLMPMQGDRRDLYRNEYIVTQSFCNLPVGIGCSRMVKFSIQRQHSAMCIAVVAPPDILDEIDIHPSPAVTAERAVHIDAVRLLTPDA